MLLLNGIPKGYLHAVRQFKHNATVVIQGSGNDGMDNALSPIQITPKRLPQFNPSQNPKSYTPFLTPLIQKHYLHLELMFQLL